MVLESVYRGELDPADVRHLAILGARHPLLGRVQVELRRRQVLVPGSFRVVVGSPGTA
jgi:hypothetical protein